MDVKNYVNELEENKQKLKKLVLRLEHLADSVDELIPKKYDYKSRFVLQDRINALSQIYDTILKYRSEISSQIKEQVNITKLDTTDDYEEAKDTVLNMSIDQLKKLLES